MLALCDDQPLITVATRAALVTVCFCGLLALAGSPPAHAEAATACGNIPVIFVFGIKTERVSCTLARKVARQWGSQCAQLRTGSCLVTALFYCRYRDTGYEAGAIVCTLERDLARGVRLPHRIRFETGS